MDTSNDWTGQNSITMGTKQTALNIGDATHLPHNDSSFSSMRYRFHHVIDPASVLNEYIHTYVSSTERLL